MANGSQRLAVRRYRPGRSRQIGGRASHRSSRSKNPSVQINQEAREGGGQCRRYGLESLALRCFGAVAVRSKARFSDIELGREIVMRTLLHMVPKPGTTDAIIPGSG